VQGVLGVPGVALANARAKIAFMCGRYVIKILALES
jgi:hypothetical protein